MFQAIELKLILSKLKSYSKSRTFDFEVQFERFVGRTVIEDLADRTAQKQQQT